MTRELRGRIVYIFLELGHFMLFEGSKNNSAGDNRTQLNAKVYNVSL